ncbi:MAG: prolyl oligopeptidase family serine peptidase [Candidatus Lokiarchaeota archaeon]|nr:prolyl oligopeptidase family serine peptidase [Candidatus Lokiarchaeota archaeon]
MSVNSEETSRFIRLGGITAIVGGILLLLNGLRFTYFGLLLATIMPSTGIILAIGGMLFGILVILGTILSTRWSMMGPIIIILSAIWGVLIGTGIFLGTILGIIGAFLIMYGNKSKLKRNRLIAISIIGLLILLPLFATLRSQSTGYSYITIGETQRQYLLHLPENYNELGDIPLLLALHGGGGNAKSMKNSYGFDTIADEYGFIVVYPDGLGDMEYQFHTWNSGYIDAYAYKNNASDVSFLYHLIQDLIATYKVNQSKIYMTGHSNGAMMTYRFAAEHSEILTAIAPVSGSVGGRMTEDSDLYVIPQPSDPLSILHVHGVLDEQVLYEGGKGEKGFLADRVDLSVNYSIQFWLNANNCSETPSVQVSNNNRIELWRYSEGDDETEVALLKLIYGNHAWENMSREVEMEEFGGTSLAELIWIQLEQMNS